MRIIRDYQFVDPADRGATAAIGNFDGVHRGHHAVIGQASDALPEAALGVLTFEPHPREYFHPDAPPFRLMSAEARASRLNKLGSKFSISSTSTRHSASSARAFAARVIRDGLGLRHVVVGADFCFGKGRAGHRGRPASPRRKRLGFGVTVAELVQTGGVAVSSTAIRTALSRRPPARRRRCWATGTGSRAPSSVANSAAATLGYPDRQHVHRRAAPAQASASMPCWSMSADGPAQGPVSRRRLIGVRPMFGARCPTSKPSCSISPAIFTAPTAVGRARRISCAPKKTSTALTPLLIADGCRLRQSPRILTAL